MRKLIIAGLAVVLAAACTPYTNLRPDLRKIYRLKNGLLIYDDRENVQIFLPNRGIVTVDTKTAQVNFVKDSIQQQP